MRSRSAERSTRPSRMERRALGPSSSLGERSTTRSSRRRPPAWSRWRALASIIGGIDQADPPGSFGSPEDTRLCAVRFGEATARSESRIEPRRARGTEAGASPWTSCARVVAETSAVLPASVLDTASNTAQPPRTTERVARIATCRAMRRCIGRMTDQIKRQLEVPHGQRLGAPSKLEPLIGLEQSKPRARWERTRGAHCEAARTPQPVEATKPHPPSP